jgi:predicted enzyme related to lactoylglutathione lyase
MMSGMSPHTHHAIDYIELAAPDLDAAKAFYTSAFGWALTDYGPEYSGIQGEGKEMGGLRQGSEQPLVILYSTDLEASFEAVTAAGGTIVEPIYAFPGGRRFHFADPAGNVLAVYTEDA